MSGERAVSVTLSYVLTLGITALLITGLLVSAGGLFERQQDRSAREQLQDTGGEFAHQIQQFDRLATRTDGTATASLAVALPSQVAGAPYSAELKAEDVDSDGSPESMLYLNGTSSAVTITIPVGNETWVETGGLQTGEFRMFLCENGTAPNDQRIVFAGGCP
jgi:hypothetical protein